MAKNKLPSKFILVYGLSDNFAGLVEFNKMQIVQDKSYFSEAAADLNNFNQIFNAINKPIALCIDDTAIKIDIRKFNNIKDANKFLAITNKVRRLFGNYASLLQKKSTPPIIVTQNLDKLSVHRNIASLTQSCFQSKNKLIEYNIFANYLNAWARNTYKLKKSYSILIAQNGLLISYGFYNDIAYASKYDRYSESGLPDVVKNSVNVLTTKLNITQMKLEDHYNILVTNEDFKPDEELDVTQYTGLSSSTNIIHSIITEAAIYRKYNFFKIESLNAKMKLFAIHKIVIILSLIITSAMIYMFLIHNDENSNEHSVAHSMQSKKHNAALQKLVKMKEIVTQEKLTEYSINQLTILKNSQLPIIYKLSLVSDVISKSQYADLLFYRYNCNNRCTKGGDDDELSLNVVVGSHSGYSHDIGRKIEKLKSEISHIFADYNINGIKYNKEFNFQRSHFIKYLDIKVTKSQEDFNATETPSKSQLPIPSPTQIPMNESKLDEGL